MAKRRISTGLKLGKKTIFVNDILKFTINDKTEDKFFKHPVGKILKEMGYKSIYMTINKHQWLELDINCFIEGNNELFAEQGEIVHIARDGKKEDFDVTYKEDAPRMYSEPMLDTTLLRYFLDLTMDVEKVTQDDFDDILHRSQDFYRQAAEHMHKESESE